jgi:hypothetical protein
MANSAGSESARAIAQELAGAELGDARRSVRLGLIVERMAAQPDASFPEIAGSLSELEALYRFMGNEHVTPEAILEPHIVASKARADGHESVIVAHDTTHNSFHGERVGLGRLNKNDQGFWAHVALAMSVTREVFGVVGLKYGTRHGPSKWSGSRRIASVGPDDPSESLRWPQLVSEVGKRFGQGRAIHVMDREADWFELLEHLVANEQRFVVRMAHDRRVEEGGPRVSDTLAGASVMAEREVQLSERAEGGWANNRARHPSRKPRLALLEISASRSSVIGSTSGRRLQLNFVHVLERDPPEGNVPVHWTLTTTEPIETAEQVLRIVDAYRARWVIEEFFKALKTGCAFEKRQLASYRGLLNALAVSLPIAALLLRLRNTGRQRPNTPAHQVMDRDLLEILVKIARRPMPGAPTARDAMYAIAGLGGHLPRNGDPGWMTLARGFERLIEAARILSLVRCDQS